MYVCMSLSSYRGVVKCTCPHPNAQLVKQRVLSQIRSLFGRCGGFYSVLDDSDLMKLRVEFFRKLFYFIFFGMIGVHESLPKSEINVSMIT